MPFNDGFKARMIQRMTGPEGISATALSSQVGVSQPTLSRWVRERSLGGMNDEKPSKRRTWTAAEKFRVVQEASQLADGDLGGLLRREGLHAPQLNEWIDIVSTAALAGLVPQSGSKAKKSPEAEKIQELEKELNRKDKALAEVTAILALKKRIREIWGDGDDDTGTRSGT